MFTGIVEETGIVERASHRGDVLVVRIRADRTLEGLNAGGSIAVSGCCLTATGVADGSFTCELTDETLRRTSFAERLLPGRRVNLERPMRADGRFGGHIVQGHGVGRITWLRRTVDAADLAVEPPPTLMRYVVEKSSRRPSSASSLTPDPGHGASHTILWIIL